MCILFNCHTGNGNVKYAPFNKNVKETYLWPIKSFLDWSLCQHEMESGKLYVDQLLIMCTGYQFFEPHHGYFSYIEDTK